MTNKVPDSEIERVYHELYIGQSMSGGDCGTVLGMGSGRFGDRCAMLNLPTRDVFQANEARKQRGKRWTWAEERERK